MLHFVLWVVYMLTSGDSDCKNVSGGARGYCHSLHFFWCKNWSKVWHWKDKKMIQSLFVRIPLVNSFLVLQNENSLHFPLILHNGLYKEIQS